MAFSLTRTDPRGGTSGRYGTSAAKKKGIALATDKRTPDQPSTPGDGTRQDEGTEPVAWVAFADDASESGVTALNREEVEEVAAKFGWQIAPLYRSPSLTDAERLAIQWVVGEALSVDGVSIQDTLRGLLERTQDGEK